MGSERQPPALRFAPPQCPKPSPLCGCVRVHQPLAGGPGQSGRGLRGVLAFPLLCGMEGIGAERGGMDARKRDDSYHRGRGSHYIGHSPTAGTLGSCHSPGPLRSMLTSPAVLALSGWGYRCPQLRNELYLASFSRGPYSEASLVPNFLDLVVAVRAPHLVQRPMWDRKTDELVSGCDVLR
jgi:hypothetical protein